MTVGDGQIWYSEEFDETIKIEKVSKVTAKILTTKHGAVGEGHVKWSQIKLDSLSAYLQACGFKLQQLTP